MWVGQGGHQPIHYEFWGGGGVNEAASRNIAQMKSGFILHSFVLSSFISWFIQLTLLFIVALGYLPGLAVARLHLTASLHTQVAPLAVVVAQAAHVWGTCTIGQIHARSARSGRTGAGPVSRSPPCLNPLGHNTFQFASQHVFQCLDGLAAQNGGLVVAAVEMVNQRCSPPGPATQWRWPCTATASMTVNCPFTLLCTSLISRVDLMKV